MEQIDEVLVLGSVLSTAPPVPHEEGSHEEDRNEKEDRDVDLGEVGSMHGLEWLHHPSASTEKRFLPWSLLA